MDISSLLAELGKLLPTIKDWVTVVAAIFGIAGFILGLLGFLRSGRVERRTFHEPYFRNIWLELEKPIRGHISKLTFGISALQESLNSAEKDWEPSNSRALRALSNNFDIEKFRWEYDPALRKRVATYFCESEKLKVLVSSYASLVWPVTTAFSMWLVTVDLLKYMNEKNDVDSSTTERETRETVAEVKAICKRYVGGLDQINRLPENWRYRVHLWLLKRRIQRQISRIQHAKGKLESSIMFHDKRFTAPRAV